ncbi:hypothetical protein F9K50_07060, partial [bacterium]
MSLPKCGGGSCRTPAAGLRAWRLEEPPESYAAGREPPPARMEAGAAKHSAYLANTAYPGFAPAFSGFAFGSAFRSPLEKTSAPSARGLTTGTGGKIQRTWNHKIEIVGSPSFVDKVEKSLDLLKASWPEAAEYVSENIHKIRENKGYSRMFVSDTKPIFFLNSNSVDLASAEYLASMITHDATHQYLYQYYKSELGGDRETLHEYYTGAEAEKYCTEYQLLTLETLNADGKEIEYIKRILQENNHWDPNGDGIFDSEDADLL